MSKIREYPMKENEKKRLSIEEQITDFFGNGGEVQQVPFGVSGDKKIQLEMRNGRPRVAEKSGDTLRSIDRANYDRRHSNGRMG